MMLGKFFVNKQQGFPAAGRGWRGPVLHRVACFLSLAVGGLAAEAQQPGANPETRTGPVTAYVGAKVRTAGDAGTLENATILVADGVILQVGADLAPPPEARIVDWSGKTVLPGVVDPYYVDSSLRPSSGGGGGGRQINVGGRTIELPSEGGATESTELLRLADVWNPDPETGAIPMRSGITTLHWVTSGYGISLFSPPNFAPRQWTEAWGERLFVAATTNTTSLEVIRRGLSGRPATPPAAGESTAVRGPGPRGRRPPRDAFDTGAESLANDWQEEGPPAEARSGAPAPSGPGSIADPLWEKVRGGELPVIINVNNAAAMLHVLKVVQPIEKARVLLVANAADVYQVRDAIKSSRVSLIVRPRLEKVANSAVRVNIARELNQAGIPFSFSLSANQADFQQSQDTPLFPVATLVRTGLDADLAVQALTKNPARALGIDQWVGSLEPKKQANLLVFDQDPLIGVGRLEQVYVEGKLVYENR